jgi:hypothetical protein
MLLPALLNPKPYGDVGDMERGHGATVGHYSLRYTIIKLWLPEIVFHIERKRHRT